MQHTLAKEFGGRERRRFIFRYADRTTGTLEYRPVSPKSGRKGKSYNTAGFKKRRGSIIGVDVEPNALMPGNSYTFDFNNWMHAVRFTKDKIISEQATTQPKEAQWKVIRQFQDMQGTLESSMVGPSMTGTRNRVDLQLCAWTIPLHAGKFALSKCHLDGSANVQFKQTSAENNQKARFSINYDNIVAEVQMEVLKENMQGEATQESEQRENTIITRDEARTDSRPAPAQGLLPFVSTERVATFAEVTNRYVPLDQIEVKTENRVGDMLRQYILPRDIFQAISQTPNIIPFETYLYSLIEFDLKFVVNANKFQCGKVICSVKFDSFQAEEEHNSVENALCRPHVILDLASNNEGNLKVPFRFRRALLRNTTHEDGSQAVRTSHSAIVMIQVFSQLRIGVDAPNTMYIRPYVNIGRTQFAGMTFRSAVPAVVQMEAVRTLAQSNTLKGLVKDVESLLETSGNVNCDKPTLLQRISTVPVPRMNFATGKGVIDATVLRMNPVTMTPARYIHTYPDEPTNMLEIAQIWGLRNTIQWSKTHKPGEAIGSLAIDPTTRGDGNFEGTPTPLEYVCSMYNFWCGTIEIRFDFVSNAFHTGAVMVCVEFGRQVDTNQVDLQKASSTYTQTFHLGEQKSLHVTVPYIYDTIWRRSSALAFNPQLLEVNSSTNTRNTSMNIRPKSYTRVVMRVVNPLRPPDAASQEIDIQVFMRASKTFNVHSLKQGSMYSSRESRGVVNGIDNFPQNNYVPKEDGTTPKPVVQMDNGEKEDLDTTHDFALGVDNLPVQTDDSQTNIKDILRRPYLLCSHVKIPGEKVTTKTHGFFVPLLPPSKALAHVKDRDSIFSELLGQTPAAQIMNMFRHWRGSMRYTIMFESSTTLYITHIPKTGTRYMGNTQIGNYTNPFKRPIYGCGLSVEYMTASVNTSMVVEVPYDSETNWSLTFEDDPKRNYTWRDKGDTNCGHIVLTPINDTIVSIWWSAGDDFQISNFYGIPRCIYDDPEYAYDDEKAVVQMDFDFLDASNLRSCINNVLTNTTTSSVVVGAANAIPLVGGAVNAMATHATLNSIKTRAEISLDKADQTMSTANQTLESVNGYINDKVVPLTDSMQSMLDFVKSKLETLFDGIVDYVKISTDLASAIVLSFYSRNYWPVATVTVNFIKDYALQTLGLGEIATWTQKLCEAFTTLLSGSAVVQAGIESNEATLIGVVIGLVGAMFGVILKAENYAHVFDDLKQVLTKATTFSYLNSVLQYVTRVYEVLRRAVEDALGLVDPEVAALRKLVENSEVIGQFIVEAQIVTSETMRTRRGDPAFRTRAFLVQLQARQIQRAIILSNGNSKYAPLARFVDMVIKKGDEQGMDLRACPIKRVPYVYTIEGPSGIGKSYLASEIIHQLHEEVNISPSTSGAYYTYQSGAPYWTNFSDQKFVLMDDYGQRTSAASIEAETDTLFNLVTNAPFTPPMAHLEDKKIYANPVGVCLLSNDAFAAHLTSQNHSKDANLRRRGKIFRFDWAPGYQGKTIADLTPEEKESKCYIQVSMYKSNTNETLGKYDAITYKEFVAYLRKDFAKTYAETGYEQNKRLRELHKRISGANIGELNFDDPYALFGTHTLEYALKHDPETVEAALKAQASAIKSMAERAFQTHPKRIAVAQMEGNNTGNALHSTYKTFKDFVKKAAETWVLGKMSWGVILARLMQENKCSHCSTSKYCYMECKTTKQIVCFECCRKVNSLGTGFICPCCAAETLEMAIGAKWIVLVGIAEMILTGGLAVLTTMTGYNVRWLFWLMSFLSAVLAALGYTGVRFANACCLSQTVEVTETQGAWPDVEPVCAETQKEEDPEVSCIQVEVDQKVLETYSLGFIDANVTCCHRELLDHQDSAIYVGGETECFKIPVQIGAETTYMHVSMYACDNKCPFANRMLVQGFAERYTQYNKVDIQRKYLDYINNPRNREFILQTIPQFLRPDWMTPGVKMPEIKQGWWDFLGEKFQKYKILLAVFGGIATVLVALVKFVRIFTTDDVACDQSASWSAGSQKENMPHKRSTTFVRGMKQSVNDAPWSFTQDSANTLLPETAGKIFRNQILIKTWHNGDVYRTMAGVGVRNRCVLIPKHYLKEMERAANSLDTITIELIWTRAQTGENHNRRTYTYSREDFTVSTDTDIALFTLPESFPMFKDIVKLFWRDSDVNGVYASSGILIIPSLRPEFDRLVVKVDVDAPRKVVRTLDVDRTEIETRHVIPYTHSERGACGSILLLPHDTRPISTLHTCGVPNGMGFGVIVTQELLLEMMRSPITQMEEYHYLEAEEVAPSIVFDNDVRINYFGFVPSEKRPYMQKKSKIEPSKINNQFGFVATTEPAILDASDKRWTHTNTPLYHGVKKHGIVTRDFPTQWVLEAQDVLWEKIFKFMKPTVAGPKRLSIKEAIVGIPGQQYYDAMKLTTSAGHPWTTMKPDKSKLAWIRPICDGTQQMVDCEIDSILYHEINRKELLRKAGIVPVTVFCDTLKDEKRKPEKARAAGGTRVFCASPVDYTVAMRQNLLHFCAAFMHDRINNMAAVGINALGPEWTRIAHKLISVSATNVMTIDYSNFGPAFHAVLLRAACTIIRQWVVKYVEGVDVVELDTMFEEIINSVHIAQGTIYQQMCGSPSGAAITAVVNSIVNMLYILVAWKQLAYSTSMARRCEVWAEFFNHVALVTYGDDLVAAVSDAYKDVFNPQAIVNFLGEYDITATDATKQGDLMFTTIYAATFLKRGFRNHPETPDLWTGPLEMRVIEEIPQWKHKGIPDNFAMQASAYTALIEAHGHGRTVYQAFKNKLSAAISKARMKIGLTAQWEQIDAMWRNEQLLAIPIDSLADGEYITSGFYSSQGEFSYKQRAYDENGKLKEGVLTVTQINGENAWQGVLTVPKQTGGNKFQKKQNECSNVPVSV